MFKKHEKHASILEEVVKEIGKDFNPSIFWSVDTSFLDFLDEKLMVFSKAEQK